MQTETIPEFASVARLVSISGQSRNSIQKHIDRAGIRPKEGTKFSVEEVLTVMTQNQKRDFNRFRSPGKERKLELECEALQLKIDESSGKLVEVESVGEEVDKVFSSIRQKLLTIPAKLAVRLTGKKTSSQIQKIITKEIHGVLNELSNYNPKKGKASKKAHAKRGTSKTAPPSNGK